MSRHITKDGLDVSFATNHLGPFLLTKLLLGKNFTANFNEPWILWIGNEDLLWHYKWFVLPWLGLISHYGWLSSISDLLKRSAPARIVNVSSVNHKKGKVDFSHFRGENLTYYLDQVYNHTKLHNIICTNELARRLEGTGKLKMSLILKVSWLLFGQWVQVVWHRMKLCSWKSLCSFELIVRRHNWRNVWASLLFESMCLCISVQVSLRTLCTPVLSWLKWWGIIRF